MSVFLASDLVTCRCSWRRIW